MQRLVLLACLTLPVTACAACGPFGEVARAPEAGLNGGFEVVRDGLPAEWLVYTPATVPEAEFAIALDEEERHEGARALRFDVAACSGEGGRLAPGMTREVEAEAGATYDVSFWVRSDGSRWSADVGGVDAKTGELERLESADAHDGQWTRVERRVELSAHHGRLRFQFNVRSPGRVWIDDVRVERAGA